MPTYEYECTDCGHRFEVFQNMSDEPLTECEQCSGSVKRLIFGGTGVIFKGSGFYINDSKGKSSSKSLTASGGDNSSEDAKPAEPAASETKTEKSEKTEKKAAAEKSSKSGSSKETVSAAK